MTLYQQGFNDAKEAILKLMEAFDIEFRNEAIRKVQELTPPQINYNQPIIKELLNGSK